MCPRVKPREKRNSAPQVAKLWVLLIGVNQYRDRANLPSLQYSALDCQGLGEALTEAIDSFEHKEVIIHHDFVAFLPNLANVQNSLAHVLNSAQAQDTILLYFSGHGILETITQQVVLCLRDTDAAELLTTGLALNDLLQQLSNCAASQQLVWLDACHSGGMTLRKTTNVTFPDPSVQLVETLRDRAAKSQGFYALLSCDRTQQSWEFPELGHGVFTYYLMRGLRGEAADSHGEIEADALYQYVYHQTLRYIDKTNQQIRLINQQKSSRGERRLQSEFSVQTPKRIVEGFGKVILGKRSSQNPQINSRQALVVDGGFKANSTTLALSQILQSAGDFTLRYFPQTDEPWSEVKKAIASCLNFQSQIGSDISTTLIYLRGEIAASEGESWLVFADDTRISRSWLRTTLRNSGVDRQIVILDCPGEHSLKEWIEDLQLETERGQCLIAANAPLDDCQQFAQTLLETLQNADSEAELPVAAWISQLQIALAGTGITPQVWLSGTQGVIEVLTAQNDDHQQPVLDLGICPYMGLEAFSADSAEYFYGRDALVQKMLAQINHRLSMAVVGASGSGKSSAVQAGLLAQLKQGKQIPGSDRWLLGCFRPGVKPIQALAQALCQGDRQAKAQERLQIEGLLYQGVEGFVRWLRTRPEPMVLLVIDQFEELFTLAEENERQELIDLILGGLQYAGDRFRLVLTLRADFVAAGLEVPELGRLLQKNSILVPPYLTQANYRQAIIKPAEQVGLKVESGLVEVLLQDLDRSAGDLPLLQFALQKLWHNRDNGKLTLKAYQELGGIKGALERQAQAVYDSLDPTAKACARWIFLNLTQLGEGTEDTRRRLAKSELIVAKYPETLVDQTLRILTDAKLLVVNLDHGINIAQSRSTANPSADDELFLEAMRQEATVEVVHEILIRHWSSLRWWLEENRNRLRSQRQVEQAALLWQQKNKQSDFLLRGVRLAEAEEIYTKYTDELSDNATEYVACCIDSRLAAQTEAKKRLRKAQLTAVALGVLGLAATAFGIGAYRQKLITQLENINSLNSVAEAQLLSNQQLESVTTSVKAGRKFAQINGLGKRLVGEANWQATEYKTAATLQQSISGTQEINRLESHSQQVRAINVSQNGSKAIATASDDGTIKVWSSSGYLNKTITKTQLENPEIAEYLYQENRFIEPLKLSNEKIGINNDQYSISIPDESTVELRTKSDHALVSTYQHQSPLTSVSISDDNKFVATATSDGKINIWNQQGILQQTIRHTGAVLDLKFIPRDPVEIKQESPYKLISTGVDKAVRIWQIHAHNQDSEDTIYTVAADPMLKDLFATGGWSGKIDLYERSGSDVNQKATIAAHEDAILQLKYSPNREYIATASADNTIKIINSESSRIDHTLKGHTDSINAITFLPTNSISHHNDILVSGSEDKTVKIWRYQQNPQLIKTLTGHTDSVKAVTVSPDGKLIASGGYDNRIKIWSIEGELLQTIKAHKLAVTSLAFTPNGDLVSASWDNTLKVWSVADAGKTNRLLHNLTGHLDGVTAISLNADGTLLASGSGDRQIKLWNIQTGELIKTLRGHTSQINSLAFSNDDKYLVSGEEQQGLFWWNLDLDHLLTQGCNRLSDYLATNRNVKANDQKLCL